jgi:hypothetical protein
MAHPLYITETLFREQPNFILIINLVDDINRVESHAAGQMAVKPRNRPCILSTLAIKMTFFC